MPLGIDQNRLRHGRREPRPILILKFGPFGRDHSGVGTPNGLAQRSGKGDRKVETRRPLPHNRIVGPNAGAGPDQNLRELKRVGPAERIGSRLIRQAEQRDSPSLEASKQGLQPVVGPSPVSIVAALNGRYQQQVQILVPG